MDRSFLSRPEVVAASRNWVCIRLATYENAEEARWLAMIFTGRSGQLENTVFALLTPDARELLAPAGRSPGSVYPDAQAMAGGLTNLAQGYAGRSTTPTELPRMADFRLALNVAACDGLPLIVSTSEAAEKGLAPAAWASMNLGRAIYVRDTLKGYGDGSYLVVPDRYGIETERVIELPANISARDLSQRLAPWREPPKDHHAHVGTGRARGIRWQTKVPVTDPEGGY